MEALQVFCDERICLVTFLWLCVCTTQSREKMFLYHFVMGLSYFLLVGMQKPLECFSVFYHTGNGGTPVSSLCWYCGLQFIALCHGKWYLLIVLTVAVNRGKSVLHCWWECVSHSSWCTLASNHFSLSFPPI